VHDTGGIHDTIEHLNLDANTGNGFSFIFFDTIGLRWAIDEAMRFYQQPPQVRARHLSRIMTEAAFRFDHKTTAQSYLALYDQILS
jgi:glycogen synthase